MPDVPTKTVIKPNEMLRPIILRSLTSLPPEASGQLINWSTNQLGFKIKNPPALAEGSSSFMSVALEINFFWT